jgi:hypothetical protein
MGPCGGQFAPDNYPDQPGLGFGRGWRRGNGRGWRSFLGAPLSEEQEKSWFEQRKGWLQSQIDWINNILSGSTKTE